ncbi:MAG: GNAT family N-acetyltransferase [Actinomycetota bacterium]|nr:GNAT family N-acetyltransferase [Actinomycetota bacterium]MDQ2958713.1 GNAT family N-acetyltransferase [Actinomycetota bacterium]
MSAATGLDSYFDNPLGGLSDQAWDELAGEKFYCSALWLRLCALAPGSTSGGVHVELPGGGRAAVPVAAVRHEPNANSRWGDQLTQRGLPSPAERGLLVGQRRGYLTELMYSPGADRQQAATELLAALRSVRLPDPGPTPCVAMYLTTPDALALRAAGVRAVPVALKTDAWIEIPDGGWDAWLDSLGSHRARRIRSEARKFDQVGYQLEYRTLRESYRDVARLLARTEERYGRSVDLDGLTRSFGNQGELAGDRAQVLLCSEAGQPPVGFCLFYRSDDTIFLRAIGFDYQKLHSATEYFNLTYYLPARLPGVRWLHAGISTPEGKALRGATLRPLWLMDLSEDSVLAGRDAEIRRHNSGFLGELADSSPVVAAALPDELWKVFC